MKNEFTPQDFVDYYWYAEQERAKCSEITLIEIAENFVSTKSMGTGEPEPFTGIKGDGKVCPTCKGSGLKKSTRRWEIHKDDSECETCNGLGNL